MRTQRQCEPSQGKLGRPCAEAWSSAGRPAARGRYRLHGDMRVALPVPGHNRWASCQRGKWGSYRAIVSNACPNGLGRVRSPRSGQYRARSVKSPATVFPGSNPGLATRNRRSSPVQRTGPGDARERCRTPPAQPARTQKPPCRQPHDTLVTSQDARTPGLGRRCQEGGKPRRSGSRAKYVPKNSPPRRLPRARHASGDGPWVPGRRSSSHPCT